MRRSTSQRLGGVLLAASLLTGALLACNAIIGVTDVTLKEKDGGKKRADGGDPITEEDAEPGPEIDANVPAEDRAELALGFLHGCGRLVSGQVKCWGWNFDGQLGDGLPLDGGTTGGRKSESSTPVPVPGISDAISIASGNSHTCIVHRTGKVSCWGSNTNGQLGDGTKSSNSKPKEVPGITDATQVICGRSFTCVLHKTKKASCWGENTKGGLGDNSIIERPTPAPVQQLSDVISLSAGRDHACAVHSNGEVSCWGANASGQLGIGSANDSTPLPVKLNGLDNVIQVAGAASFTCARQSSGRVYCWGTNVEGQLGNGSPPPGPATNPSPILVPSLGDAIWIWTGFEHACAIKKAGTVLCWGRGQEGQLGLGQPTDGGTQPAVPTPTVVPGTKASYAVFTGGDRACALSLKGEGLCWGSNAFGQLGVGTTTREFSPKAMVDWP